MTGPRIGELFAGYGGLGLGVRAVIGGDVAWYADVCKFDKDGNAVGHHEPHRGPCRVMAHHYPDAPNLGDVTQINWSTVPPVDVLTGGSPCQDLSHAGRRAGMSDGTRSNLWVAMREGIAQLRPRLVVWENVRGAYSADADSALEPCPGCMGDPRDRGSVLRALGRVLGDLSDLGYVGGWHGLPAAHVGACHQRFRVFVVAHPAGDPWRFVDGDGLEQVEPSGDDREALVGTGARAGARARGGRTASRAGLVGRGPGEVEPDPAVTLLPTPVASDASDSARHTTTTEAMHSGTSLTDAMRLLPTPSAVDDDGGQHSSDGFQRTLPGEVRLLPTPEAKNSHAGQDYARRDRPGSGGDDLVTAVIDLLPTPSAAAGEGGQTSRSGDRKDELLLGGIVQAYDEDALLPTPRATDGTKGGPNQRGSSGDLMLPSAVAHLPTPTTQDASNVAGASQQDRNTPPLNAVVHLLPTPNDFHAQNTESPEEWLERRADVEARTGTRHGPALPVVAWSIADGHPLVQDGEGPRLVPNLGADRWGVYAPAVRRWEALTRPAPDPTEPGPKGGRRLAAQFAEWMMGLPDGWITAVPDITRNEALKLAGNGVVPQQAAAAVWLLLNVLSRSGGTA